MYYYCMTNYLVRRTLGELSESEVFSAQRAFLEEFVKNGVVGPACERANISREVVRVWLKDPRYEDFQDAYGDAKEEADDYIRREINRRAVDGWEEPVFQGGVQVGTIRKYSDSLLTFLAKARMPEFKDTNKVELTGRDGGPVEIESARERLASRIAISAARTGAPGNAELTDGGGS